MTRSQAWIAGSPGADRAVRARAAGRRALHRGAARTERAPAALRARIEAARPSPRRRHPPARGLRRRRWPPRSRRSRWRWRLILPAGTPGAPSVSQAAALAAARAGSGRPPAPNPERPGPEARRAMRRSLLPQLGAELRLAGRRPADRQDQRPQGGDRLLPVAPAPDRLHDRRRAGAALFRPPRYAS